MQKTRVYEGLKVEPHEQHRVADDIALEYPLTIEVNGDVFSITMQSPGDEVHLARGLVFTEGICRLRVPELPVDMERDESTGYIRKVSFSIEPSDLDQALISKRNLLSATSCGICGTTELKLPAGKLTEGKVEMSADRIRAMYNEMEKHQQAFWSSGGIHAAAAFNSQSQLLSAKEDIGRHNAVDKVIGELLSRQSLSEATYLLVSGRISFEIVAKCFAAGIPVLCSVSAPSSLAIDFAKELGITLAAFCRDKRFTLYAYAT
jgi:FdhD protein